MAAIRSRFQPLAESLEGRLALSAGPGLAALTPPTAGPQQGLVGLPPAPVNQTLAALGAFSRAYLSRIGEPNYSYALDLNHNGQIGQEDGKLLLHALPPLGPEKPIDMTVTLAPEDRARGPHQPHNSGGVTHHKQPLILGRTVPGALVFAGTGTVDLRLHSAATVADAGGDFAFRANLPDGINQFNFEAVDPYGRQYLRAFPIYWLDFARYESAHPMRK